MTWKRKTTIFGLAATLGLALPLGAANASAPNGVERAQSDSARVSNYSPGARKAGAPISADGPRGTAGKKARGAGRVPRAAVVTLVTGDRITLYAQGASGPTYEIERGPGREKMQFTAQERDGHLSVFPVDALPLVARGLMDRRLFDITQLVAWGYDDGHSKEVPLIVRSSSPPRLAAKAAAGGWRSDALKLSAMKVAKSGAGQAWQELTAGSAGSAGRSLAGGVTKVWLDGKRTPYLDRSVPQIGAPVAWKRGLTGKGVTVAVLDNGYDSRHPDLQNAVADTADFSGEGNLMDGMGHGTHLASVIAGSGKGSGGKYRGVAPDAKLAIGKVAGVLAGYSDSSILRGMDWAAAEVKAKVALLSLGTMWDSQQSDPLEEAVNTLTELYGTLFVVAAGNDGPGRATLSSPGTADAALTVGAVNKSDMLAGFSGRGPRTGDHAVKPDITAPGVAITAGTSIGLDPNGMYTPESGTSLAAAHVAGAAAILAQAHPDWKAEELKGALIGTAVPSAELGPYEQGAGRVDVAAATGRQVTATPGNLWTTLPYGEAENATVTRTVTYTNSGDASLILDLRMESARPGVTLPRGLLKLASQRLKVPAHGQASVTLAMAASDADPGEYPGVLVASAGDDVVLRTLAGAYVEPETYDVTFKVLDRNGEPAVNSSALVYDLERDWLENVALYEGVGQARLPAGDWTVQGYMVNTDFTWRDAYSAIAHTVVHVDAGHKEVVLDARKGRKVTVTLDDPDALQEPTAISAITHQAGGRVFRSLFAGSVTGPPVGDLYVIPSRVPGAMYQVHNVWYKSSGDNGDNVRYDLVKVYRDGLPDNPVYNAAVKDLAKITMANRGAGLEVPGAIAAAPSGSPFVSTRIVLPGTLVNYRTYQPGLAWDTVLHLGPGQNVLSVGRYVVDRSYSEVWGRAAYGPGLQPGDLVREGDELSFAGGWQYADPEPGRIGMEMYSEGEATLTSGGKVLGHTTCVVPRGGISCGLDATLPGKAASYTLTEVSTRNVPWASLATRVETSWTFDSETAAWPMPISRLAARISPTGLDTLNRAKRTVNIPVGISIDRIPMAPYLQMKHLTVEASYDDGATWQPATVRKGSEWQYSAVVKPSAKGDFVSLRVTATATGGMRVSQTVIRAYGLTD
ncbi:serine protease [Sphaerisporangium siamense]|uniref:Subtilisin family serine protease n=1 Tax=Sphaerisporangium siamense TaxID=795645 RepID=A0A7W7D3F0_9ACTN|nr:S8 family serine peptidase [Sphaerisporangium siamense]MBB4699557.1 subtilisin family serine protease [Sphaerisporangium siamense]GII86973.1 serine protease [Sphaerisporangium siamense]